MDSYNNKLDKIRDTILKLEQLLDNLSELDGNSCLLQGGHSIQSFVLVVEDFKLKVITELEKQKVELYTLEHEILNKSKIKENVI